MLVAPVTSLTARADDQLTIADNSAKTEDPETIAIADQTELADDSAEAADQEVTGLDAGTAAELPGLTDGSVKIRAMEAAVTGNQLTLYVNSAATGGADASHGDNTCATAAGICTLRAAIEEANAQTDPSVEVTIKVEPGFSGTIVAPKSNTDWMKTSAATDTDKGAYYNITRTMAIDLDNRLHLVPPNESLGSSYTAAGFYVNASKVELYNFSGIFSTGSSIVFGPNSDYSVVDGDPYPVDKDNPQADHSKNIQSANYHADRGIVLINGADHITIKNLTIGRMHDGAAIMVEVYDKSKIPVEHLTISNVTFDNTSTNSTCGTSGGGGCSSNGFEINKAIVNGLAIENCHFNYFPKDKWAIYTKYAGSGSGYWNILRNTFNNIVTGTSDGDGAIELPTDIPLAGESHISYNTFDNTNKTISGSQGGAIQWNSNAPSTPRASNLFIEDNFIDGYGERIIYMYEAGTVTVQRNRFGTSNASRAKTEEEETADLSGLAMFSNAGSHTNRDILTWYPTDASIVDCELKVTVAIPSSHKPDPPVTLDFYYTKERTAEEYLGSVVRTEAGTVTLPIVPDKSGYIRLQTQGSQPDTGQTESSQYSRAVKYTAPAKQCEPNVEIDLQAWADVPNGANTYDEIIEGTWLKDGTNLAKESNVWMTYTVTNTGDFPLHDLVVKDDHDGVICEIKVLSKTEVKNCVYKKLIPKLGVKYV
jgi:adhesin/invasin